MVSFELRKCDACGLPMDLRFFGLSSGLGPSSVRCRRCQRVVQLDRGPLPREAAGVLRLVVVSLVLLLVGGVIGGNLTWAAREYWRGNPRPENLPWGAPGFVPLVLACAGALALVLGWKAVRASRQPGPTDDHLLSPNLVFGAQLKVLLGFLALTAIGWLKLTAG